MILEPNLSLQLHFSGHWYSFKTNFPSNTNPVNDGIMQQRTAQLAETKEQYRDNADRHTYADTDSYSSRQTERQTSQISNL